jgi:EAL domain-containing protein (putative c-di-GMP-specific phosphodiesterase class I)
MAESLTLDNPSTCVPFLEHYPERNDVPQRIPILAWPFRLGRSPGLEYTIYSSQVSKQHAEIVRSGDNYCIRDLGSTNGTFVNGRRVAEATLSAGDIIHLARKEFRFGLDTEAHPEPTNLQVTAPSATEIPVSLIRSTELLRELIKRRDVRVIFQPIVHLETVAVLGYEALGRSTHAVLNLKPTELFNLAEQCRLAPELSRLFQNVAVEEATRLPAHTQVFLNLHPAEMHDEWLVESARDLQSRLRPTQKLVLEVHEDAVADVGTLMELRNRLHELNIGMAYDDFGSGQSRLNELAEAPPNFIKLHLGLIRDIHQSHARQELVQALNHVSKDLGVDLIAEGIETAEEAEVCRSLGCRFGQGYLFGRPQAVALLQL